MAKEPVMTEDQGSKQIPSRAAPQNLSAENCGVPPTVIENQSNDGTAEMGSVITDHKLDIEIRDTQHSDGLPQKNDKIEATHGSNLGIEQISAGDQDRMGDANEAAEVQRNDDFASHKSCSMGRNLEHREGPPHGQSPKEAIKMIDKDKVKAALEKRRKARREVTMNKDVMDEDDLIERELEDGVELAVEEDVKNKWERRENMSKSNDTYYRRDDCLLLYCFEHILL